MSDSRPPPVLTPEPAEYNIEAIARLERESMLTRTPAERISDVITRFTGSMTFVVLHLALFLFWVVFNLEIIPLVPVFDPFPFGILTLIMSSEGVFLAIFILIRQNRMSRQADRRAHLGLQVSMLAEQELTTLLRIQKRLCEHLGVDTSKIESEARRLMRRTDVGQLANRLDEKLTEK